MIKISEKIDELQDKVILLEGLESLLHQQEITEIPEESILLIRADRTLFVFVGLEKQFQVEDDDDFAVLVSLGQDYPKYQVYSTAI